VCPSSTITLVTVIAPPIEVLGLPGSEPFVGCARVAAEATPARQRKDFQETCFNRIPISQSPALQACALFQLPDALPRNAKFIANFLQRGHFAIQPEAAGQVLTVSLFRRNLASTA